MPNTTVPAAGIGLPKIHGVTEALYREIICFLLGHRPHAEWFVRRLKAGLDAMDTPPRNSEPSRASEPPPAAEPSRRLNDAAEGQAIAVLEHKRGPVSPRYDRVPPGGATILPFPH